MYIRVVLGSFVGDEEADDDDDIKRFTKRTTLNSTPFRVNLIPALDDCANPNLFLSVFRFLFLSARVYSTYRFLSSFYM